MITDEIRRVIENNTIGFVATVDADGFPCVSPKATFLILDDTHLAFGDRRSPNTVRNIAANPAVEVNFIDIFRRVGCRIRGEARYVARDTGRFAELLKAFARWDDFETRLRGFVEIEVTRASMILSPAYDTGAEEAALIEEWLGIYQQRYGGPQGGH